MYCYFHIMVPQLEQGFIRPQQGLLVHSLHCVQELLLCHGQIPDVATAGLFWLLYKCVAGINKSCCLAIPFRLADEMQKTCIHVVARRSLISNALCTWQLMFNFHQGKML